MTLSNITDYDLPKVGLRAIDIAKANKLKVQTPLCFVVPHLIFEEFLLQNRMIIEINNIIERTTDINESLQQAYLDIRALFENSVIPEEFKENLMESYEALSTTGTHNAQAFLESDVPIVNLIVSPSYQQSSERLDGILLNIQGFGNLMNALKSCWLSLYLPEHIKFRKNKGITDFSAGVIIQTFKDPDVTIDASTKSSIGNYEIPMHAYFGLPDITYGLSKDFYSISRETFGLATENIVAQEYFLLKNKKSGTLLKRNLGKRGLAQKIQYKQILEIARMLDRLSNLACIHFRAILLIQGADNNLFLIDRLDVRDKENERNSSRNTEIFTQSAAIKETSVAVTKKEESLNDIIASASSISEPDETREHKEASDEKEHKIDIKITLQDVQKIVEEEKELKTEDLKTQEPKVIIIEDDDNFILSEPEEIIKEEKQEEQKINNAKANRETEETKEVQHTLMNPENTNIKENLNQEQKEKTTQTFDPNRDFYLGIILDIEPALDQEIMEKYRKSFGTNSPDVNTALNTLIDHNLLPEKEQILKLKEMKKLLEDGETINLDLFLGITEKLRSIL